MIDTQIVGDYEFSSSDFIGHGAFAVVYKGHHKKTGALVAIKSISKKNLSDKFQAHLTREIAVHKDLSELHHDNLVQLLECVETRTHFFLVMEYCNGGDLAEYLLKNGTLNEVIIRHFIKQLANAMQILNVKGVLHRDLKPQNILLSTPQSHSVRPEEIVLKIADFGFARCLDDGVMATTLCGSPFYMSPEVISSLGYDNKSDLWSLGVIIYQCLNGSVPFPAKTPIALKTFYTQNSVLNPWISMTTSSKLRHLILGLLQRNREDRIGFSEFISHPFLNDESKSKPKSKIIEIPTPEPEPIQVPVPVLISELKPGRKSSISSESDKDSAYSSCDDEVEDFVVIPSIPPKSHPITMPKPDAKFRKVYAQNSPPVRNTEFVTGKSIKWSQDVRSLSPPRVTFSISPKFETSRERQNSSPFRQHFSSNTPAEDIIPPPLTQEILYSDEHNSTLAKLNFALKLSDCVFNLAKSKGIRLEKNDSEVKVRSEQISLHIRSMQLLSSALRLGKQELEVKRLHPTSAVKQILQELNAKFKTGFIIAKKLFANFKNITFQCYESDISADRLIYAHAIELCQSAASDEVIGYMDDLLTSNCFQKYQTAQILLHSLHQQVGSEVDKSLLGKYRDVVEKRLSGLSVYKKNYFESVTCNNLTYGRGLY